MDKLIEFFKSEDMYNEEFFEYIKTRTHEYPYDKAKGLFGCFPIVENEKLVDIKLCVPEIVTLKDFLINIHEYTHAIDLYNELGSIYIEDREKREKLARYMEKKYLDKSFNNPTLEDYNKKR